MKQPGTKGWWGKFRDWHSVNESEQRCGPLCGWQTDRSLRTGLGYSQSRGLLASNSSSAPLFPHLRSSWQMWLNQYGSTIRANGSHPVTVTKPSQTFFQKQQQTLCHYTSRIWLSAVKIATIVPTLICPLIVKIDKTEGGFLCIAFAFFHWRNQGLLALTKHSAALKAWQKTASNVSLCRIIKDFTV